MNFIFGNSQTLTAQIFHNMKMKEKFIPHNPVFWAAGLPTQYWIWKNVQKQKNLLKKSQRKRRTNCWKMTNDQHELLIFSNHIRSNLVRFCSSLWSGPVGGRQDLAWPGLAWALGTLAGLIFLPSRVQQIYNFKNFQFFINIIFNCEKSDLITFRCCSRE